MTRTIHSPVPLILFAILCSDALQCRAQTEPPHRVAVRTDKEGFPVIAVWREDWGIGTNTDFGPHVITAVWPDGEILWSQDNLQGGPPYFVGQLDRKTLSKALADLEATGAFTEPCARRSYFAPDSYCLAIFLASGTKTLMSRSWHELVEQNPKAVAASFGSTSLKDQSREEFLKADKPEYQRYRRLWSDIRAKVRELVPETGKPLENVEFERRKRIDEGTAKAVAEDHLRRQEVDLSQHRLSTVRLVPSSPWMKGQHWIVTWELKQPSDGGQVFVFVGMGKKVRVVGGL